MSDEQPPPRLSRPALHVAKYRRSGPEASTRRGNLSPLNTESLFAIPSSSTSPSSNHTIVARRGGGHSTTSHQRLRRTRLNQDLPPRQGRGESAEEEEIVRPQVLQQHKISLTRERVSSSPDTDRRSQASHTSSRVSKGRSEADSPVQRVNIMDHNVLRHPSAQASRNHNKRGADCLSTSPQSATFDISHITAAPVATEDSDRQARDFAMQQYAAFLDESIQNPNPFWKQ